LIERHIDGKVVAPIGKIPPANHVSLG
jgi:hypothetical protein